MRYILPEIVKNKLAERSVRLHHLLWHTIRNSWHNFTEEEQETFRHHHPNWVPLRPRFVRNPSGAERINPEAGEAFFYMHRKMLSSVNAQLAELNEPAIIGWQNIPGPNDADYPVPGRNNSIWIKSDALYYELREKEERLRNPERLRGKPLAFIGVYVESSIHDLLHMRWAAESPAQMGEFPQFDPANINPTIDTVFDSPQIDWLGHPYSSHVNSDFWKLHAWCDQIVELWREANNLHSVTWTDTWVGNSPHSGGTHHLSTHHEHDHFHHGHHSEHELIKVFKTLNSFKESHAEFDYVLKKKIPLPELDD